MNTEQSTNTTQPLFEIQRLYVKEKVFKIPHASVIFTNEWKPDIHLEMNVKFDKVSADQQEVSLRLHITAKNQQRTAFTLEVQQAGLFKLSGFTDEQLQRLLHVYCPDILYPYARKSVADATVESGFPPLVLSPMNFEGLYQQQQMAQQQEVAPATTSAETAAMVAQH